MTEGCWCSGGVEEKVREGFEFRGGEGEEVTEVCFKFRRGAGEEVSLLNCDIFKPLFLNFQSQISLSSSKLLLCYTWCKKYYLNEINVSVNFPIFILAPQPTCPCIHIHVSWVVHGQPDLQF